MPVTTERNGSRIYLLGDTYPIKDRIKQMGGHWDGDRKAWWFGTAKAVEAQNLITELANPAPGAEQPKVSPDSKVIGKAKYKNKTYYILWMGRCQSGQEKAHLTVLDGSIDFWADMSLVQVIKTYPVREYRGREQHQTLGSLQRFIERQRDPERRQGQCTECGEWGPCGQDCHDCHEGCFV